MHLFQDYELKDQQQHSDNKLVFDAVRISDQQRVRLNYYQTEISNYTNLPHINNTFNCLKAIKSPYLLKIEELLYTEEGVAVITEPYHEPTLSAIFANKSTLSLTQVLTVIVQVSSALKEIHSKLISHQEIAPHTITFDPEKNKAMIVDYGICRAFQHKKHGEDLSRYLYISPEQTGRMNRSIDHRSDLYSLGVVFYQLLTGQCPFQSHDILELIHAHIAQQPVPPHKLNPAIPVTISKIVMKLLCKEAEKRYQSTTGLNADIYACLEKLKQTGQVSKYFEIGAMDLRSKFQIPEKLYGRNHEIQLLLNTFENSASGNFESVAVGGYSGVGKSALINEIQKPLVAKRGLYTQGKYDQFKKAQPYSAVLQALTDMIRQILTKPQDQVDEWKHLIISALNGEGQCLIDVLPILEALIDKQPALEKLNSIETQTRFNRTCEALIRAFSSPNHPFILFLDDLQWADLASLNLISHLLKCQCPYMMLIMAYRDNEVDSHHPFSTLILHGKYESLNMQAIALQPIKLIDIQHLVSETLHQDIAEIEPLAQELMLKTQGNPFFLTQLFSLLYQDELVIFSPDHGWQWDIDKIQQASLSNDVVVLMTSKLKKYPQKTQSALNMGGILGAEFQISMASLGLKQDPDSTYLDLLPAIQDGLIKELTDRLKFAHDKIHESSYALMPKHERTKRHALIAKFMLETFDQDTIDAELFTIVEHLNNSSELVTTPEDTLALAKYNYQAGIKAKQSSAFEPAVDFLLQAKNYLDDSIWQQHPGFAYDLHFALAQAAYTTAKFELSERIIQLCLDKVQEKAQIPPLVQLYQDLLFADSRHEEGINFALNKLKEYGVNLPAKPSKLAIFKEYFLLKIHQRFRPTEALIDLPEATNQKILAIIAIIANMVPSCYMTNSNLMGLISLRMANLSLKYGNNIYSSFGFGMTGLVETGIFKRIKSGRKYYDLSYAIEEKYPNKPIKGRNMMLMSSFAGPWTESIKHYKQLLEPARALNAEQGILQWSDFCVVFTRAQSLFFGRDTLTTTYQENEKWLRFHIKNGDQQVIANQKFLLYFIRTLQGTNGVVMPDISDVSGDPENNEQQDLLQGFDESQHAIYVQQQQNVTFEAYYSVLKQMDSFLKGDYKSSVAQGLALFTKIYEIYGIGLDAVHRHIYTLAYLAMDKASLTSWERIKTGLYFKLNQFYLWVYQNNRPDNFSAYYTLLKAEAYRSKHQQSKALEYFEKAINQSQDISLFTEALTYERLANFHQISGRNHSALLCALQAKKLYKRWGNNLQVERLTNRFPDLALMGETVAVSSSSLTVSQEEQDRLDIMSLTRGSQAISSEVQLDQLIATLLKQLIQTAGADKAILLFEEYGQLHIQGEINTQHDEEHLNVISDQALPPNSEDMAETVIRFVERSKTCEVLSDAASEGNFTQDPYIVKKQLKSLLCMPILHQGKLLGILYLENNLTTDAFTSQHQDVLQILASQAAISIVNARLYAQLEDKVTERTQELKDTMEQLIEAEKMASLGQLVSGVAHEINTPIGIGVTTSTLMQHKLDEITKKYQSKTMSKHEFESFLEQSNEIMDMLLKSINHIAELVTRFKTVSVDQSEEQKSRFYVHEYLQDIQESFIEELQKHHHTMEIHCPEALEMQSYPLAFSLIFKTLISNSLNHGFHEKKHGKITVYIRHQTHKGQDTIEIEYYDNGAGIKEEYRKKVFEPFFTTNMGESTGLGLHIIYNVITQQFDGSIRCEAGDPTKEIGAHFVITLPKNA